MPVRQKEKNVSLGVDELSSKVDGYSRLLTALKDICLVPIGFAQIESDAKGYYHTAEQRIALQEGMSEIQTVKTLIHEMAHQKLHSHEKEKPREERLTSRSNEVEAEVSPTRSASILALYAFYDFTSVK